MSSFVFIGGDPAIDFLNTEIAQEGRRIDLFGRPDDVLQWLKEVSGRDVRSPLSLPKVKQLRAAARVLIASGRRPRRREVDVVNAALARGRGSFQLRTSKGEIRTHFQPEADDALFMLASYVADFLASADLSLVKPCQGTNCVLHFYDTTKSHTRRWCSMAGCGNRMKAALHYRRSRAAGG